MFTKGRLLVASPPLIDPNFDRTVVFMLEHNDDGAVGVVLNRPSELAVVDLFEPWAALADPPAIVFQGGPVQADAVMALARRARSGDDMPRDGWSSVVGEVGTVDLSLPPGDVCPLTSLRLFMGYSGWAGGQLEYELSVDAWMVVDAEPTDPFVSEPGELWRTVLGRQPGSLGWMGNYPDDVSSN